jgi:branched-chain amino acid transport system permease protein
MEAKNTHSIYIILISSMVLFLTVLPALAGNYIIILLNFALLTALLGFSFTFLLKGGYLSLGIAGFYGVGAYTVALFYRHIGQSFWLGCLAALITSGIASLLIGLLCIRLQRMYFGLLTFAFSQMIWVGIWRWTSVTGGDDGIAGIPRLPLDFYFFKIYLKTPLSYYYFTLTVFLIVVVIIWMILNSNFGQVLTGMGRNLERTVFVGIKTQRHGVIAFIIHGLICGLAGALQVPFTSLANPELAHVHTTVEAHISCFAGGLGTFSGPLIGSILYVFLKSYLITWIENWMLAMGSFLVILVLLFHEGIMGFLSSKLGLRL